MKYLKIIGFVVIAVFFSIALSGCTKVDSENDKTSSQSLAIKAEKIEVVHFHATQQCVSCKAVGRLAKKTIEDKFPEELKNGTIVFREINLDLSENKEIVAKYQASGSALFINAIADNKNNIEEDTTVWRLVSNDNQYIAYFEKKLNNLLGK